MSLAAKPKSPRGQLGARMAAVAALAFVMGLVFNSASPLGVRATAGVPPEAASAAAARSVSTPGPSGQKRLYDNETVGLSLETQGEPAPAAGAAAAAPLEPLPGVATLTWPETSKLLAAGQVTLVDARMAVYYQTEHVPGAVSLPANASAEELAAFAAKYPKSTPLVVYCGSLKCPLSHQLIAVLTGQLGYTNVRDMPGGFAEYRQFQSQLAKGATQ